MDLHYFIRNRRVDLIIEVAEKLEEKFSEISPWDRYNIARKAIGQLGKTPPQIPKGSKDYTLNVLSFEGYMNAVPLASEFVRNRESALETTVQ